MSERWDAPIKRIDLREDGENPPAGASRFKRMTDKHPRGMTLDELDALPVVDLLFGEPVLWYDDGLAKWHVGQAGGEWVRVPFRGDAPGVAWRHWRIRRGVR